MIDLHFLGMGSAFCPQLGNTSAYFQKNGALYLLDCGSLVFGALLKSGVLSSVQSITVLITHLHADHVGSLGTLISHCKHITHLPIRVVHAEEKIADLLRLNGITDEQYTLHTGLQYRDDQLSIRLFPVPHTQTMSAYGALLADEDEQVYYSGDAGDVPDDVWQGFLAGRIARMYEDVSLIGQKGGSHGDYAWFLAHCPPDCRHRFFPMHLNEACLAEVKTSGFGLVRPGE